jgi:nitroreductase
MKFDLTNSDALLTTTRSVRKRLDLDRPVPREIILECLEIAIQAPTGSNRQGWRWVIIEEPPIKRQIAEIYKAAAHSYFVQQGGAKLAEQDPQVARIASSFSWLAENLDKVPLFVIPCIEGRPQPDWPASRLAAHFGSIFPAIWNFQLALRSRGLGSTLTTLHLTEERKAAEILGIPEEIMQVALLPVGYTKGTEFKRAARMPVKSIVHWNRW